MNKTHVFIGAAAVVALLGLVVWKRRQAKAKDAPASNPATAPINPDWWTMAGSWRGGV